MNNLTAEIAEVAEVKTANGPKPRGHGDKWPKCDNYQAAIDFEEFS
jgi:hypothetical protein